MGMGKINITELLNFKDENVCFKFLHMNSLQIPGKIAALDCWQPQTCKYHKERCVGNHEQRYVWETEHVHMHVCVCVCALV